TMPIRLFVGSFIGRLLVALLGFYLIMQGQWERALLGLFGFLIARLILVQHWQPQGNVQSSSLDKP
ncbi:MAG: ATP synthase subunit I, partial [Cyanobacteriota bacterium]|nr:ATP synthase subunit I [Cyanobacteriota bacterium]